MKKLILIVLFFSFLIVRSQSPVDTSQREYKPVRLGIVGGGSSLFYAGTLTGLATVWYQDNDYVGFHLINDNAGWLQIDKYGHAYTTYLMGRMGIAAMKWSGVSRKKSIWWGGSYGFLFMTSIEIIDGHYSEWGFSPTDMLANAAGSMLLIGQELAFDKQILTYKFSYHHTELAAYKPGVLGASDLERVVADYNGQTFWLSLNLSDAIPNQKHLPKWLSVSGGYGANGMLSGETNPTYTANGTQLPHFDRYRSYYLSLDIDFDKIKTRSKFLKSTFFFLNMLKFPLPTVEFTSQGNTHFHPFYF